MNALVIFPTRSEIGNFSISHGSDSNWTQYVLNMMIVGRPHDFPPEKTNAPETEAGEGAFGIVKGMAVSPGSAPGAFFSSLGEGEGGAGEGAMGKSPASTHPTRIPPLRGGASLKRSLIRLSEHGAPLRSARCPLIRNWVDKKN